MKDFCFKALVSVALAALGAGQVQAQAYPSKPIHIIVPYDAGGSSDVIVRAMAPIMERELGQRVVIENKSGASGAIGSTQVARAQPDGYTFLAAGSANSVNATFAPGLPFDTRKDLVAVAPLAVTPFFFVSSATLPVASLKEFIALAKNKPGSVSFGSSGTGSNPHLAGEQFSLAIGSELLHVPYKGTAPAVNDLIAGHVQMVFTGLPSVIQHYRASRLRILAIAAPSRSPLVPEVPTMAEAGVPNFNADVWFGILAPRDTPLVIREKVAGAIRKAVQDPEMVRRYEAIGAVPFVADIDKFQKFFEGDIDYWQEFLRKNPQIKS